MRADLSPDLLPAARIFLSMVNDDSHNGYWEDREDEQDYGVNHFMVSCVWAHDDNDDKDDDDDDNGGGGGGGGVNHFLVSLNVE